MSEYNAFLQNLQNNNEYYNVLKNAARQEYYRENPDRFAEVFGEYAYICLTNRGLIPHAAPDIDAAIRANHILPRNNEPKQSARLAGRNVFVPDNCCSGKLDSIMGHRILNGIRIENRCYDVDTVARFEQRISPFTREPFSDEINERIDTYINSRQARGVKKSRKPKKSRKFK